MSFLKIDPKTKKSIVINTSKDLTEIMEDEDSMFETFVAKDYGRLYLGTQKWPDSVLQFSLNLLDAQEQKEFLEFREECLKVFNKGKKVRLFFEIAGEHEMGQEILIHAISDSDKMTKIFFEVNGNIPENGDSDDLRDDLREITQSEYTSFLQYILNTKKKVAKGGKNPIGFVSKAYNIMGTVNASSNFERTLSETLTAAKQFGDKLKIFKYGGQGVYRLIYCTSRSEAKALLKRYYKSSGTSDKPELCNLTEITAQSKNNPSFPLEVYY